MSRRLELHDTLCGILGSKQVYFQPPETIKMQYPAIVYSIDIINTPYADNRVYLSFDRYSVTVIDRDPDSIIPSKILSLPMCEFDRFYTKNNLNHYVFKLYF